MRLPVVVPQFEPKTCESRRRDLGVAEFEAALAPLKAAATCAVSGPHHHYDGRMRRGRNKDLRWAPAEHLNAIADALSKIAGAQPKNTAGHRAQLTGFTCLYEHE